MATIRPLNDRVIIKRTSAVETITPGGIVIPEQARERPQEGIVIAVRMTLDIKPGDRVLFGKFAGTEIKLDGEDYLIMREDDILGVIEV